MKDHNLATNSTSNKQQLSNLKQKHRIEIDKLTSNHTSELEKLGQQHTLELSQQKKKRERICAARKIWHKKQQPLVCKQ